MEYLPAIAGALASAIVLSINRRQKDIRELFRRVNKLEMDVARLQAKNGSS
tara:strand:+ start:564 stop:716 length:153 start_codon:yes stop_codon:yes gene_type:complete